MRSAPTPALSAPEVVARVAEHLEERRSVIAVHDLMASALAHAPGRVTQEKAPPPPPVIGHEERERRREKARVAANRARQDADAVHRQLEAWETHLAGGQFEYWIAHAEEVAHDPDPSLTARRRLEEATALASERLETHETYRGWHEAYSNHAADAASLDRHVLDHPGHGDLVTEARRLAARPSARASWRTTVVPLDATPITATAWLRDFQERTMRRRAMRQLTRGARKRAEVS